MNKSNSVTKPRIKFCYKKEEYRCSYEWLWIGFGKTPSETFKQYEILNSIGSYKENYTLAA